MDKRAYGLMCLLGFVASGPLGCTVDRDGRVAAVGMAQWSLQPNTLVADGSSTARYQLTVYRAMGGPWDGAQFAVDASDAHVLVEEPPLSDPLGTTSATVRCTQAGAFTLAARVYDGKLWYPLAGTARLVCDEPGAATPGPPATSTRLAITALHDVAATDANAPVPLTLVMTDAQGQPLANQRITLTASRTGDQVAPSTAVTDARGQVQVLLTATSLGVATVVAQVGPLTASATVQFVAGAPAPATSTFGARPGAVVADGHSSQILDVIVRDNAGRRVPYAAVTFTSDRLSDVLSPTAALTDVAGRLSVALTSTWAGSRNVTALTPGGPLTASVALVAGPTAAAQSQLALTPAMIAADGISASAVTILLADARGNPISNANVTLSSSVMTDVIAPAAGVTLADGTMTATIAGTFAGSRTITVQSGNLALTAPLALVADAPSSGLSTLTVTPPAPTAGIPGTLELLLLDGQHNPIAGQAAILTSSVPGDVLTANPPALTGADGRLTASLLATLAGPRTLTVAVAGLNLGKPLTILAGPPSAGTSTLDASPSSQVANNASFITLTAIFKDAFNNPIANSPVTWSGGLAEDSLTAPISATDGFGAAVNTLRSTLAHTLPVYAQQGNVTLVANVTFVAGPLSAAGSTLALSPNVVTADGVSMATVTVFTGDAQGNPIADQALTLTASGTGNTLGATSGSSDGSGLWSTTVKTTQAQTTVVTATAGGCPSAATSSSRQAVPTRRCRLYRPRPTFWWPTTAPPRPSRLFSATISATLSRPAR